MNPDATDTRPTVAIVGGGLAGLAAAAALASANCRVQLFETRRMLGGRATSFRDPASGELVDHCQHVGMGCCTNLGDFCGRTGLSDLFRRDRVLHFIGPDGKQYRFEAVGWLPAPLHLLPGFWRLKYLASDRLRIARAMWKLMRMHPDDDPNRATIGQWLVDNGQSPQAIEYFWGVILVSALGEELNRASLAAARKVIVDGFLAARDAYTIDVPEVPLGELYGERLMRWFLDHHVEVHLGTSVRRLTSGATPQLELADGQKVQAEFVVLAVPWTKVADLFDPQSAAHFDWLQSLEKIDSAPITGIHLWFDRPIMDLPHAVLVGRLGQWIFNHHLRQLGDGQAGHYYQVVISASRALAGRDRDQIAAEVCDELAAIWPEVITARLLRARVVTEQGAVFSPQPETESLRPGQRTACPRLFLAGDWTRTAWPATMESAVRSGYLAAEGVLDAMGCRRTFLADNLRRGWLAKCLIR